MVTKENRGPLAKAKRDDDLQDRFEATGSAADFLPARTPDTIAELKAAARDCRGCELFLRATQTVFGTGPAPAPMMFIGEVPGD